MRLVSKTLKFREKIIIVMTSFALKERQIKEGNETLGWKGNSAYSPFQLVLQVKRCCVEEIMNKRTFFSRICRKMGMLSDAKT